MIATQTEYGFDLSMTRGDTDGLAVEMVVETRDSAGNVTSTGPFDATAAVMTVRTSRTGPQVFRIEATSITDGVAVFDFPPALTEGLDAGAYVYDVQATTADGVVKTPLGGMRAPCRLTICQDVTHDD